MITPQFAGRGPRNPEPPRVLIYDAVTVRLSPADLYLRALARRARNSEGFGG